VRRSAGPASPGNPGSDVRGAVRPEDLSEEDLSLIAPAEVPAKYAYLDADLADWMP
jgi:hypothetical protein